LAVGVAAQEAGKGADHGGARNFSILMKPCAVRRDPHFAVARIGGFPAFHWWQFSRRNKVRNIG